MAIGFSDRFDFSPIVGWELYQVTIDKYHVMFWFEDETCLLNVADRFSFMSADKTVIYTYEIYGAQKSLNLDRILRVKVADVRIVTKNQLDLVFETGDILSAYDNPEFRSWWFLGGLHLDLPRQISIGDSGVEDLTEVEILERSERNSSLCWHLRTWTSGKGHVPPSRPRRRHDRCTSGSCRLAVLHQSAALGPEQSLRCTRPQLGDRPALA